MRKFATIAFAAMLTVASMAFLGGCSESDGSSSYEGDWVFVSMTSDGTTYTIDDVEDVYTADEMCTLELNSDGTFDLLMFETTLLSDDEEATWAVVDDGLSLSVDDEAITAVYDDTTGYLTLDTDDTTSLVLEKSEE